MSPNTGNDSSIPPAGQGSYTVLARRYRPRTFAECIGQEHVAQALRNAITGNRVAHAYLFTGARGVGKTSMARIFARSLNCVGGPTPTPCDACDICSAIALGEDVDVIEIDGASNRGIDEVREIRQAVHYRPSRARYKIYIIDEVHMLTKEAFNALLKTLEEPPAHAKFLFATTEPQKIPITILSRCQRFDFGGIPLERIVSRLREIVEAEGMSAEDEALEILARRAGGSMRDSQSLLDQMLAFGGDRLTTDDVHRLLGTAGEQRVLDLAQAILAGESAQCLKLVQEACDAGVHLSEWIDQDLEYFRDLLVVALSPDGVLVSVPNRLRMTLQKQAAAVSPERLIEWIDLLASCRARMRSSTHVRTLVEITLVRMCRLDQFIHVSTALASATSSPETIRSPTPSAAPAVSRGGSADSKKNGQTAEPAWIATAATSPTAMVPIDLSAESLDRFWAALLGMPTVQVLKPFLEQSVERAFVPPATLRIVFRGLARAREHCDEPGRKGAFEEACSQLANRRILARFDLAPADASDPPILKAGEQGRLDQLAREDPLVKRAMDVLKAKYVEPPRRSEPR